MNLYNHVHAITQYLQLLAMSGWYNFSYTRVKAHRKIRSLDSVIYFFLSAKEKYMTK